MVLAMTIRKLFFLILVTGSGTLPLPAHAQLTPGPGVPGGWFTCPFTQGFTLLTELYNVNLKHYFYTQPCYGEEVTAVLSGAAGAGWQRTGRQYVIPILWGSDNQMCRFYGSFSPGPNSHLYVFGPECAEVKRLESVQPKTVPRWNSEDNAGTRFQVAPLTVTGECPDEAYTARQLIRIVRLFNDGPKRGRDSNHRFLPDYAAAEIAAMVSEGWVNEGPRFCLRSAYKDGISER